MLWSELVDYECEIVLPNEVVKWVKPRCCCTNIKYWVDEVLEAASK